MQSFWGVAVVVATLEFVWSVLCSCYQSANKIEGYLLMIYWTSDTVVIEMGIVKLVKSVSTVKYLLS